MLVTMIAVLGSLSLLMKLELPNTILNENFKRVGIWILTILTGNGKRPIIYSNKFPVLN